MKKGISRRQLLRALGISAAAAPLIPALDGWAQTATPKRLLLVFSPGGTIPENFFPTGGETDFTFAPITEPLAPFRDDLILISNLKREWSNFGGSHEQGIGCLWTNAGLNPGNQFGGGGYPSGPSIDQILARGLPKTTDFPSLAVGVQPFGPGAPGDTMLHMNYSGSDQPLASEESPYRLFEKLYGAIDPVQVAAQAQARKERKSIIDLVQGEIADVIDRVGSDDRRKIAAHLEATRAIETRLDADLPEEICGTKPSGQLDLADNANFPALLKLQSDLVLSAFRCDRTRIATLQWSRAFSEVVHTWLGITTGHHTIQHDTSAIAPLTNIGRWYMEQLAYLLGELKKTPEGSGTMLDNTLVVYGNELHTGADHLPGPLPLVLAGGLGGLVRTGRHLDFGGTSSRFHHLLTTICNAMGLTNVDHVGNIGTPGKLPGILV